MRIANHSDILCCSAVYNGVGVVKGHASGASRSGVKGDPSERGVISTLEAADGLPNMEARDEVQCR